MQRLEAVLTPDLFRDRDDAQVAVGRAIRVILVQERQSGCPKLLFYGLDAVALGDPRPQRGEVGAPVPF